MNLKYLTEDDRDCWEALVRATPESGFMQSWAWSEFKQAEGQKVRRIGIFEKGLLLAGAIIYYVPSSIGASPLELPHGPVLPWGDADKASVCMGILREELAVIAEEVSSPLARVEPFMAGPLPGYMGRLVRAPIDLIPTPTLLISLGPEDRIFEAMSSKGRYNTRLAFKKGVKVTYSQDENAIDDFYGLFELTFTRHNFCGEAPGFFKNMMKYLGPGGMARAYFAAYKGVLVSSAIAVYYGGRATYLYGGSLPFLTSSMASYALHRSMMVDGFALGCRIYDMYGIAPKGQHFHPYAKFSDFKSRFGGAVFASVGAHDIYYYSRLAGMWADGIKSAEGKPEQVFIK